MSKIKFHRKHMMTLFFLTAISYPAWFLPGLSSFDDLGNLNIPQRSFLSLAYRHFQFPFWNPYNFLGQPFLAAGQSGPLYLPNLVYILFPMNIALRISYISHELLLAMGMYILVFHLTKYKNAALVSAVILTTSGFFVGHQVHTQMFDAFCWLPIIFYFFLKLIQKWCFTYFIAFSISFSMEMYAGHPQMTFFIYLILFLYFIFDLMTKNEPKKISFIFKTIFSFIIPLLIAAPQLCATLNLLLYSNRTHPSSSFLLAGSLTKQGMLEWFFPPLSGNHLNQLFQTNVYWEFVFYCGLLSVILSIGSVFFLFRTHRFIQFCTIALLLFLTFSFGGNTPVGFLLVHIPGFDFFRIPVRYTGVIDFFIAISSGYGVLSLHESKQIRQILIPLLSLFLLFSLFISFYHLVSDASLLLSVFLTFIAIIFLIFKKLYPFFPFILIISNVIWCGLFSPFIHNRTLQIHSPVSNFISTHLNQNDPFSARFADLRIVAPQDETTLDRSILLKIPSVNGYDSLVTKWYGDNINLMWSVQPFTQLSQRQIDQLDVKYLIINQNQVGFFHFHSLQHWKLVFTNDSTLIYKNLDSISPLQSNHGVQRSTLLHWTFNRQVWSIQSPSNQQLTLSESYDPNWKIFVNGKRTNATPSSDGLIQFFVPKGRDHITLVYFPMAFYVGVGMDLFFILGIGTGYILYKKRRI